jgi:hypothetical protein
MSEHDSTCDPLEAEEWRPVVGYEGLYEISSHGRLRSIDAVTISPGGKKYTRQGRLISLTTEGIGYWRALLYRGDGRRGRKIHQLVAESFLPPKPTPAHVINHIDGVRKNNRPENLEWVTQGENIRHAYRIGLRRPRTASANAGEKNGHAKHTDARVREIRALAKAGIRRSKIAAAYGVPWATVGGIVARRRWRHVQ